MPLKSKKGKSVDLGTKWSNEVGDFSIFANYLNNVKLARSTYYSRSFISLYLSRHGLLFV